MDHFQNDPLSKTQILRNDDVMSRNGLSNLEGEGERSALKVIIRVVVDGLNFPLRLTS